MKRSGWITLFAIILAANLLAVYNNNEWLRYIAKPLLVIILIGYFIFQTRLWRTSIKKWVLIALFFSWLGDVLLMFEEKKPIFFLLGLSAFLLAHIYYIVFFHNIRLKENVKSYWLPLLIVAIYYAVLIFILSPYLGEMKLPVRIYGIVISFMFMLAMHMLFIKNKMAGRLMMAGALFFLLSDSLLAFNKFYQSFEYADILIMLTYGLAQFFITDGAIRYIQTAKSI
ncbi:MAG TPA: lysoplasmalogenase [Chitinophagaceae bacterium]|nr:lysoplasmalogenase [Chitinophagaceae bacterium]